MLLVVAAPLSGLLELFFVVPLGIIAGIYGVESVAKFHHRRERSTRQ